MCDTESHLARIFGWPRPNHNAIAPKRDLHRRIVDPAMRYLIVTARAAETRQGLSGAKRNRAGSRQRCETPGTQ